MYLPVYQKITGSPYHHIRESSVKTRKKNWQKTFKTSTLLPSRHDTPLMSFADSNLSFSWVGINHIIFSRKSMPTKWFDGAGRQVRKYTKSHGHTNGFDPDPDPAPELLPISFWNRYRLWTYSDNVSLTVSIINPIKMASTGFKPRARCCIRCPGSDNCVDCAELKISGTSLQKPKNWHGRSEIG